jgi:2-oxoglutarate dehydrogenase E1 component
MKRSANGRKKIYEGYRHELCNRRGTNETLMAEPINISSLPYVEELYRKFLTEPSLLPDEWRQYFNQPALDNGSAAERAKPGSLQTHKQPENGASGALSNPVLSSQLNELIHSYRAYGHLRAQIDPLQRLNLPNVAPVNLAPEVFGFTDAHMDKLFATESIHLSGPLTLRELIDRLERIYCGPIGFEFMHIGDRVERQWLQQRIEQIENRSAFDPEEQRRMLSRLIEAQTFEQFIRRKFLGAKSFSLEGAESLIPLLEVAIGKAAEQGVLEIVMAMAHRGRLNVLANILHKPAGDIFREFIDPSVAHADGSGDVKYHLGHGHDYVTPSGQRVHLSLCFNPSHLEFVNPVAMGRVRAKQDRVGDLERQQALALLIHGDAAFAGEGITQETLNLSRLVGYEIGGTLHVVVNNQIGFTTPPRAARSSVYATDVAKILQLPIFHVNGDNPEAVAYVVRLASDFRRAFRQDAVIDLYCYRRLGHNEGDEPTFTQPRMYQVIAKHVSVRQSYSERLLSLQRITKEEIAAAEKNYLTHLESEFKSAAEDRSEPVREELQGIWAEYRGGLERDVPETLSAVEPARLAALLELQTRFPEGFHPHPKILRAMEARRKMAAGQIPLDWSAAEALAFASLVTEGTRIRLSGQDSGRGTFSQRHAILHDYQDGHEYVPLQHIARDQAAVEIIDSPLSEAGVLGFEYGYSLDCPGGLVLWEAQFGDFSNAAQVIIDQFITTAEEKWRRLSGLVLLLPHGFEGMGPEHSSARLERFLQLGARDNIQIIYPTTPAQYFHCLRRQGLSKWRKPLVVMTPKSLLRHSQSVSSLDDFAAAGFQTVIADEAKNTGRLANRVLLCSGKIYFDLDKRRRAIDREELPIIRIEQLYPFPEKALQAALSRYAPQSQLVWVQEEPENMGAWWYLNQKFTKMFGDCRLSVVARPEAASPATGSATRHREQQEQLLDRAFERRPVEQAGFTQIG